MENEKKENKKYYKTIFEINLIIKSKIVES